MYTVSLKYFKLDASNSRVNCTLFKTILGKAFFSFQCYKMLSLSYHFLSSVDLCMRLFFNSFLAHSQNCPSLTYFHCPLEVVKNVNKIVSLWHSEYFCDQHCKRVHFCTVGCTSLSSPIQATFEGGCQT